MVRLQASLLRPQVQSLVRELKIPQNARPKKKKNPQNQQPNKRQDKQKPQKKQSRGLHSNFWNNQPQMPRIRLKIVLQIFVPLPTEGQPEKPKYVSLTAHRRSPADLALLQLSWAHSLHSEHTWSLSDLYHQVFYFPACLCVFAKMPGAVADSLLIQVLNK